MNLLTINVQVSVKWITKKKNEKKDKVFPIKGQKYIPLLQSCKIYQGDYIFKDDYIGETEHNVVTRWDEHNNPMHDSEPAHHVKNDLNHSFNSLIISDTSTNKRIRKNLEAT